MLKIKCKIFVDGGPRPKNTQFSKNLRFYEIIHFWSLITGTEVIHQSSYLLIFFMYTQQYRIPKDLPICGLLWLSGAVKQHLRFCADR